MNTQFIVAGTLALTLGFRVPAQTSDVMDSPNSPTNREAAALAGMSLEQLLNVKVDTVYAASKHEQKLSDAPATVTVIPGAEMAKFGNRTLAEALSSVCGVYVLNDRNYSFLGIRGFNRPGDYGTRTLLLVDGHRLNDNIYSQASIGMDAFLDVDLIERLEVIRGPGSALYGRSALLGVINVIPRTGKSLNGFEASLDGGSLEALKGRATFGRAFSDQLDWLVSGSWFDAAGNSRLYFPEFDAPETDHGLARNLDHENAQSFFTRLRWSEFLLSGGFARREKQLPTAAYATVFNDPRHVTTDERAYAELRLDRPFTEASALQARVSFDHYTFNGIYPLGYTQPAQPDVFVINRDLATGQSAAADAQWTLALAERVTLISGTEYRLDFRQDQSNDDLAPPVSYLDSRAHGYLAAAFAQAEYLPLTNLSLTAGVRYDYYSSSGGAASPRAGVVWHPWSGTTLKLLYGEAFRAPNPYELFYTSPGYVLTPGALRPEKLRTGELVLEQRLNRDLTLRASLYQYKFNDLIELTESPTGEFLQANVASATSIGLEYELEYRNAAGWLLRASHAVQRATDDVSDLELNNSPRHLAKASLLAPLVRDRLFAGVEVQYTGPMHAANGGESDAAAIVNLTLFSRELLPGLEASASLYNVFNERYSVPANPDYSQRVIEQDGRGFRLKLTRRF